MADDIYTLLKKDHEAVASLFAQIEATKDDADPTRRKALFDRCRTLLLEHSDAEKKAYYTKIRGAEETRDIVLEGEQEHHVVTMLLTELATQNPGTEQWMAKLVVLEENVEHHVEEEENEMFPASKKVLSKDEAIAIGREFLELKQAVEA